MNKKNTLHQCTLVHNFVLMMNLVLSNFVSVPTVITMNSILVDNLIYISPHLRVVMVRGTYNAGQLILESVLLVRSRK